MSVLQRTVLFTVAVNQPTAIYFAGNNSKTLVHQIVVTPLDSRGAIVDQNNGYTVAQSSYSLRVIGLGDEEIVTFYDSTYYKTKNKCALLGPTFVASKLNPIIINNAGLFIDGNIIGYSKSVIQSFSITITFSDFPSVSLLSNSFAPNFGYKSYPLKESASVTNLLDYTSLGLPANAAVRILGMRLFPTKNRPWGAIAFVDNLIPDFFYEDGASNYFICTFYDKVGSGNEYWIAPTCYPIWQGHSGNIPSDNPGSSGVASIPSRMPGDLYHPIILTKKGQAIISLYIDNKPSGANVNSAMQVYICYVVERNGPGAEF